MKPMRKNSTLIYFVNRIQSKKSEMIKDKESINKETRIEQKMPSEKTVENILNFARVYEVLDTRSTGHVEMILN